MSPIATGADKVIEGITSNYSADRVLTRVNAGGLPFKKAAEIRDDITPYYEFESDDFKNVCKYDRKLELLAACYGRAASRLEPIIPLFEKDRTGVILGIGADATPFEVFEDEIIGYLAEDRNIINELCTEINKGRARLNVLNNPYDIYSIYLAKKFNAGAFQKSVLTACVSSTQAIGLGYDSIIRGETDIVIAGGTDSLINILALISFGKLGVIAESTDGVSCKPFDINRFGALAGECAGFLIMASDEFMEKNKLDPVIELLGYGNTLDAYKITAPDPEGNSMTKAISDAMKNANLEPGMIDYINAHGTGTRHNDQLELKCFSRALGDFGKKIPISSTKDRHGHAIAAAGIQEVCILMELMKHNIIPGNLNLKTPCDDSYNLVRENTSAKIKYALSSNFAFGGINTVLAIKNEMQ